MHHMGHGGLSSGCCGFKVALAALAVALCALLWHCACGGDAALSCVCAVNC